MKFKIIILLFLSSCVNHSINNHKKQPYSSKGFANILYDSEYAYKNISNFFVSHSQLRKGTKIRITNPENNESLDIQISSKGIYENFYKIIISESLNCLDILSVKSTSPHLVSFLVINFFKHLI